MQDTVQEMAKDMTTSTSGATQASAAQLYDFMKRVCPPAFTLLCLNPSRTTRT